MIRIFKPTIFVLCLVPFIIIAYQILFNQLGAEPVKQVTHHTGEWTLRFILLSLAMTPLKNVTKILAWIKYRRMLGLFAFFMELYICLLTLVLITSLILIRLLMMF